MLFNLIPVLSTALKVYYAEDSVVPTIREPCFVEHAAPE
jgi:hypothetical protein